MKSLLTTFMLAIASYAFSQSEREIKLDWYNNQFKIESGDTSKLHLPFSLRFKESNFKTKTIQWVEGTIVTPGSQKIFGTDIKLAEGDNGYYTIKFEVNEGIVVADALGETKLPDNSFTIEIGGKRLTFKYNKNSENEYNKEEEKEEKYIPGYIYYDAIALVSSKIKPKTKLEILKSYDYKGNPDNPYLKSIYDEENRKAGAQVSLTPTALFTNLGNTDVTYFAAGLARFLAERTKEELNEAFFSKMKEQLNAYPELTTVFPNTSKMLNIIETYSYSSVIQVLKEAFETDVQNLPENLYNIKDLNTNNCSEITKDKLKTNCEERMKKLSAFFESQDGRWVGLGMFTVKEGIQSSNPAELLKTVIASQEFTQLQETSTQNKNYGDYNVASSIALSNFISQSLISKDDKQIWVNSAELNKILKDKNAFKVYLGLLLSFELRNDDNKVVIKFYKTNNQDDTITFGGVLQDAYKKYKEYEPQVSSLITNSFTAYNAANNAVKKIIAAADKSVEVEPQALYNYYRTLTASLKPIAHSPLLNSLIRKDFGAKYDNVEQFLNPAVDIAYHISTKKYSAAIYDASILLSVISKHKFPVLDKTGKPATDKKGNPKEEKSDGLITVTKSFVKYGTLISTVANAQSSEEVKQALDASVLPVGSYSIKRKTNWSFSINSYVGTYWSYSNNRDYIPSLGLTAPIGFNISKGFSKSGNCGGLSLNLQILDVGALVNYYLIKGDTASLPNNFNVKLSNVFAPGFNLSYNIPKTPLSIAWGGQYIPTLYKYEQINGKNEYTPTKDFRIQLSLLIDVPLFNLKVWDFRK